MKTHYPVARLAVLAAFAFCLGAHAVRGNEPKPFDVAEKSIDRIHAAMSAGELTCRALVETYLDRIAKYDQPTGLNSILKVNPDARSTADQLDREFRETGRLRPLHGIDRWNHPKPVRSGQSPGRIERRHCFGCGRKPWDYWPGYRYRQFDSRPLIACIARWSTVHDGSYKSRWNRAAVPPQRCWWTHVSHSSRCCEGHGCDCRL